MQDDQSGGQAEFSVVICCYEEEHSLQEFYSRLKSTLDSLGRPYELVFVNDGSRDGTFSLIRELYQTDIHVRAALDLYDNAGQASAFTAGFLETTGDKIVLLDSDLQLDPEDLPLLVAESDKGYDVVSGRRLHRQDAAWRKFGSVFHNMLVRRATKSKLTDFGCTFKIVDARLIRAFEVGPFRPVRPVPTIARAGSIVEVDVNHHPRNHGRSGWTAGKFLRYIFANLFQGIEEGIYRFSGLSIFCAALFGVAAIGWYFAGWGQRVLTYEVFGLAQLAQMFLLIGIGGFSVVSTLKSSNQHPPEPAYIIREALRRGTEAEESNEA